MVNPSFTVNPGPAIFLMCNFPYEMDSRHFAQEIPRRLLLTKARFF